MMSAHKIVPCALLLVAALVPQTAFAHFPWLIVSEDGKAVYFFGEGLTDRTYHLPESVAEAQVQQISTDGKATALKLEPVETDDLVGKISHDAVSKDATLTSTVIYGVHHNSKLTYYTIHQGNAKIAAADASKTGADKLPLNAVVSKSEDGVTVRVMWKDQPLADAKVRLYCEDGHEEGSATTDANGLVSFTNKEVEDGLNGIVVGHTVQDEKGTHNGTAFSSASHYLTLTFERDWE
ncbi:hypothetical protein [Calycomorphotria hydatis]|uniref:Nickel uptake substrate-specific transmembrane region n=1 Tax=Calycomorphotria hydatis TaxID=2528027 RepID=A0A517T9C4_9PLAN|nr:hypothetical protein [Calycomorphotria hydatis]QDT64981.1 Nickel uptake substrate-specific transmembrane region [Calycomorphotria hydatis]